jgi:hypothetical protein
MLAGTIVAYNPRTGRAAAQVDKLYTVFEVLDDWEPKIGSKVYGDDLLGRWEGTLKTESSGNARVSVLEINCTTPRVRVLLG